MSYPQYFFRMLVFLIFGQLFPAVAAPQCNSFDQDLSWSGGGAYPQILKNNGQLFVISDVAGAWKSDISDNYWHKSNNGLGNLSLASLTFSAAASNVGYAATAKGIYRTEDNATTWHFLDKVGSDKSFIRWDNYRSLSIDSTDPDKFYFGTQGGEVFAASTEGASLIGQTHNNEPVKSVLIHSYNRLLTVGSAVERVLFQKINDAWQLVERAPISVMDMTSIHSDNKEYIFTVGNKTLRYSTDGANEWSDIYLASYLPSQAKLHRVAVATTSKSSIRVLVAWFDGWKSGMLYTDDVGATWHALQLSDLDFSTENPTRRWKNTVLDRILSIYIDPENPNSFFMTTYWGIWRTNDSGLTWQEDSLKGASNRAGSSVIYSEKGDLLTASMDVGIIRYRSQLLADTVTVSQPFSLLPNSPNYNVHRSVAGHMWNIVSIGDHIVATNSPWDSEANQIVMSSDYGLNWTIVTSGLPIDYKTDNTVWHKGFARALEFEPNSINTDNDFNRLYLGIDGHGLYVSIDGGVNWQRSTGQPQSKRIYNALSIDPINAGVIYWGAHAVGMFVSNDSGNTWHLDGLESMGIFDSAFSSSGMLYAGVQRGKSPELYVKSSFDESWELLNVFPGEGTVEGITVHPSQPSVIAVGVNGWSNNNTGKVYITFDAGVTWQEVLVDVGVGVADMAFSPCNNELAMIEYAGGLKVVNIDSLKADSGMTTLDYISQFLSGWTRLPAQ
ncbi:hypothetical protein [Pseudoalteromonas sp. S1612]|uniref:sialidase family protein n=1 Tax=Pseudoalteromonas sp. S1612 TaxID=579507 RepID=UPI00110BF047|nr:hypothetical protein [Pseudoalteromonas sp. S1612]